MPWPRWRSARPAWPSDHLLVINLSGRGDKDVDTVAKALGTKP